jgi:predicted phosphodiesterase
VKLQLLSDLHLESEDFEPRALPGADLLLLAGDIDSTWTGYRRFAGWPVPVLVVAGNHEFDGRELNEAWPAFRALCVELGFRLLECESVTLDDADGSRVRFLGTIRWSDFAVFGEAGRARAERAGSYFQRVMGSRLGGAVFDVAAVRAQAEACRRWLEGELQRPPRGRWERTVVVTHFAPSLRSADPRFGGQPGTASFCNADDDLIPRADHWLHGHLHCRHDYFVTRGGRAPTRVRCQARGLVSRGEAVGWDEALLIQV